MGMDFKDLAQLTGVTSQPLGVTDWQSITAQMVQTFADLTGDHQWIHLDAPRAKAQSPFGGPIVHGALILALVPVMVGQLFVVPGATLLVNAGLEKARLRAPVPIGARIRGRATLKSAEAFDGGVLATIGLNVEIEGQARAACTANQRMVIHD